ncbi:protein kinase domain-containing protein [Pedobacter alpinus]|uniref:Protein kinase domain-containing protein n=1 Tax=Pedobacter alpinus TaxID=1590643 RepID=A0ABW5TWN6_9SPHI
MPKNFNLQSGSTLSIADIPLDNGNATGGEGAVYEILSPPNYRNSVAKILYPEKRTNERRYKVRYMVDNPPANIQDGNGHNFLIWPQQILLDNNDFVGFIMPKAEGIDLEELCRVKLKPELGSEWQKFYRDNSDSMILRLILCSNIAKAVNALHATGHYVIGDLKPENIRVKSNGLVSILDLDSCQISDGGQIRFQSKMNTTKYNPPDRVVEHKELSWDLFILGIIFYEILFGCHPGQGTLQPHLNNQFTTPELKLRNGYFPFGSNGHFFDVIATPHNDFKNLPYSVQKLFLRCFDQGITNPAIRPNTTDWLNNLTAKPKIVYFKTDKETIISGVEVTLNWQVEGADEIEINNGIGSVSFAGQITIRPQTERQFRIKAINKFGSDEQEINLIIFPTPIIETLVVPTPDIQQYYTIDRLNFQSFNIDLSININVEKLEETMDKLIVGNPQINKISQVAANFKNEIKKI